MEKPGRNVEKLLGGHLRASFQFVWSGFFVVMGLKDRCLRSLRASIWKTSEGWPTGGTYGASWHKPLTTNDLIQTSLRTPESLADQRGVQVTTPSAFGLRPRPVSLRRCASSTWIVVI
jgi:hypothetical protein